VSPKAWWRLLEIIAFEEHQRRHLQGHFSDQPKSSKRHLLCNMLIISASKSLVAIAGNRNVANLKVIDEQVPIQVTDY
jgi:hypothetical protein